MEPGFTTVIYRVNGMSCASCELKIENALKKMAGVQDVKVSQVQSTVKIRYDSGSIRPEELQTTISALGFEVTEEDAKDVSAKTGSDKKMSITRLLGLGIIVFALYWVINSTIGFKFIPEVDQSVSYGMLFIVGLLTSLHCVAMCGGINISQCISHSSADSKSGMDKFRPSLLYNLGRVISYTVIGGIVGALGGVISFSGPAKGLVAILGGVIMVLIGVNMLELFPWLKRFKINLPKLFGNQLYNQHGKRGPFIIGLFNGLMPCGPLQTMQLYAMGTGNVLAGATSMFLFSLGTVPLMFGIGAISSLLSGRFTHRMLKVSAVLVIVLGFIMVGRGMSLSGISLAAPGSLSGSDGNVARIEGDVQVVTTTLESGRYQPFIVQQGIPVRWNLKVAPEDLNGCNNPVTIPKYNITKRLYPGDNIIEFTPTEVGNIRYTCWMGMISSNIKVVSDISKVSGSDSNQINSNDSYGDNSGAGDGSCCAAGAVATRFYNGRIPTDIIEIAKVVNGVQEVTVTVNDEGYTPAVVILQRGMKGKIRFRAEKINSCNYAINFPDYRGQLDLSQGQTETPVLEITEDFTFACWMGMLHGYVKVVDDLKKVDLSAVRKEIDAYRPPAGSGGGGCCGG